MDELKAHVKKYDSAYIREHLLSSADVTQFAATFYRDVAEIYDSITLVRNIERNPTGFSYDDAPILGLLVRAWKLLKEIIRYYEDDNAEIVGVLERPFLEAVITARFLAVSNRAVVEDYRKCSYKDRLRLLANADADSGLFETKPGKRLLSSIQEKLRLEGLSRSDFETQRRHRWRIQGKSFYDIFAAVEHQDLYASTYGMMSESIHGSWNDSMDYDLVRHEDGSFGPFPFFQPADIRYVTPALRFANPAYRLWLQRIDAYNDTLAQTLDWVERVNKALFLRFDETFDGP